MSCSQVGEFKRVYLLGLEGNEGLVKEKSTYFLTPRQDKLIYCQAYA